jgi:hypothetical protein
MKKSVLPGLALLISVLAPANAQDSKENPLQMDTTDLSTTFRGMTMIGKYGDGTNFRETYHPDGSITYVDDLSADKGRWFVRGKLFCTFYDVSNGACFSVQRSGKNCYEYYIQEEEDGSKSANPDTWNSIGWDETKPSTCDLAPKTA